MANSLKNGDAKLEGLKCRFFIIHHASQLPNTTETPSYSRWSFFVAKNFEGGIEA